MFNPHTREWSPTNASTVGTGQGGEAVSAIEAVRRIGERHRLLPVGVIGGRNVSAAERACAFDVGRALATAGFPVMTGGKDGIMEAACEGAVSVGGLTIGILPDNEWSGANSHVTLPIATGLGSARNVIIARACFALIAIGGEFGTQTEMAFGMHFGRLVLGFGDIPNVKGVVACQHPAEALEYIAQRYLALDAGGVDASDDGAR